MIAQWLIQFIYSLQANVTMPDKMKWFLNFPGKYQQGKKEAESIAQDFTPRLCKFQPIAFTGALKSSEIVSHLLIPTSKRIASQLRN